MMLQSPVSREDLAVVAVASIRWCSNAKFTAIIYYFFNIVPMHNHFHVIVIMRYFTRHLFDPVTWHSHHITCALLQTRTFFSQHFTRHLFIHSIPSRAIPTISHVRAYRHTTHLCSVYNHHNLFSQTPHITPSFHTRSVHFNSFTYTHTLQPIYVHTNIFILIHQRPPTFLMKFTPARTTLHPRAQNHDFSSHADCADDLSVNKLSRDTTRRL